MKKYGTNWEPIPAPIAERYLQATYLALIALLDVLMTEHGAEWEIGKAVEQIVAMFPDKPELQKALGDYAAGVGGLSSAQAAQSTLFLLKKIEQLIEDVADLKTLVRDNREQLEEVRKEINELRMERREAGADLQAQINVITEQLSG